MEQYAHLYEELNHKVNEKEEEIYKKEVELQDYYKEEDALKSHIDQFINTLDHNK